MTIIAIVCLAVITVAFVVAVVYLIQTLYSIKKAADELEILLKSINHEVDMVTGITSKIHGFINNLVSPWAQAGGWLGGLISSFVKNKREEQEQL